MTDVIDRLLALEVSAVCDADKGLPVVDPAIRAMLPDVRIAGPAFTVLAPDDHLPVFSALAEAEFGDVLVIVTGGGQRRGARRAVRDRGEAARARGRRHRRPAAATSRGCAATGCRCSPAARSRARAGPSRGPTLNEPVSCGGVDVNPGDIVFADDDGVAIASAERFDAALEAAEHIGRAEGAMLEAMRHENVALHDLTNWAEHVAALDRGEESSLRFEVDVDG